MTKSLEQKLYEAFCANKGLKLTADDVASLVSDDTIGTRISNVACQEAGEAESGIDFICGTRSGESWVKFVEGMIME